MRLGPTTVTFMPHVSMSQEASGVAVKKDGLEMELSVLVSVNKLVQLFCSQNCVHVLFHWFLKTIL